MKHPVTKQKRVRSRSRSQYSTFAKLTRKKLTEKTPIVACTNCKQPKVNHRACPNCHTYGGKKVVGFAKTVEKITKVKA